MDARNLLAKLRLRRAPAGAEDYLLPAEQFVQSIDYERRRTDRSGQPFSLIVLRFDAHHRPAQPSLPTPIADTLAARLRDLDRPGWLHDGGLGILTPYTKAPAAKRLADELIERLPESGLPSTIDIYEYPPELPSPSAADQVGAQTGAAPLTPQAGIESLLSQPMPFWKRTLDVLGAATGLLLLAPLLAAVALAVKLSSPGPIIFAQRRAGRGGKPFWIYKFRTMVADAERQRRQLINRNEQDGPAFKIDNDPRITRIGRWLRKTSIDELPQLCNVLRGEMSLVGPRPLPCHESDGCAPWQRQRLSVTPGMTCIWQINDRTNKIPFAQWMRMDLQYIQQVSLKQDLSLLLKTISFVVGRRGL